MTSMSFFIYAFLLTESSSVAGYHYYMPGLNTEPYIQEGDITLGMILSLTEESKTPDRACTDAFVKSAFALQTSEAMVYAVQVVNEDPYLLPNVSMGFVILDGCSKQSATLASSVSFLPIAKYSPSRNKLEQQNYNDSSCDLEMHYDVIGLIGPSTSSNTVPVSSLFSVSHLPIVGATATSDALSDKAQHPNYFRVVPPDMHQMEAILTFVADNDWSYISVVYSQGDYGEKAFDNIKAMSPGYGICIASHHRLVSNVDYNEVAQGLIQNPRARVVVLIADIEKVPNLFEAIRRRNYTHYFVWVGSDAWAFGFESFLSEYADMTLGAFSLTYYSKDVLELYQHIQQLSVNTSQNPVLKATWEYLENCSFDFGTCDANSNILLSDRTAFYTYISLTVDSVLAFAHAAHDLLQDRCPSARGQEARACITGELLKEYLRNTSFDGTTGRIEFDEFNDVRGKYRIRQFVHDYKDNVYLRHLNITTEKGLVPRDIGMYFTGSKSITYNGKNISWSHLDKLERIVPLEHDVKDDGRPESVCSRPCLKDEYRIEKELSCCWECRRCRNNEKLILDNASCEVCPAFTWPDPSQNLTECIPIPLTFSSLTQLLPVLLLCMALLACAFTVLIILAYVKYRNERVIKAGSRELSFLQLLAIFLGYVTVIISQLKPNDFRCKLVYLLFCFSFAWLYCPLLVKTVRIYRIFRSSSKTNARPRFVSPQSQLVLSIILLGVQIVLCTVIYAIFEPSARRHQPVWSQKLVELTCDLTVPGLASFLAYNLVLVTLCSLFAFKTRKLPDNFNESRFISMCVFTTLIIWLAFIPTYFTAQLVFVRALLLSLALLLNHTVALLFLFVPKVYAAAWLPPASGNFVIDRFQTQTQTQTATSSFPDRFSATNRVGPVPSDQTRSGFDR